VTHAGIKGFVLGADPRKMKREYRQLPALVVPAVATLAFLIVVVGLPGSELATFAALVLAFSLLFVLPMALTGRIEIEGMTMTARGFPPIRRKQHCGPVQLDHLARIKSVYRRNGVDGTIGPAFSRMYLHITDTDGADLIMWAWGWGQKGELFAIVRQAAVTSGARLDPMTARRLKITYQRRHRPVNRRR
jgi:hypothetical protein